MLTGKQLLDILLNMPKEDLNKYVGFPDARTPDIIHAVDHVETCKNVQFSQSPKDPMHGGIMYTDVVVMY